MKHLILLHGALGASPQLQNLKSLLSDHFTCHAPDFYGHGDLADSNEPFSIEGFAAQIHEYCNQQALDEVSVFGYSMGGYVGLYLARHQPDLVKAVCTLGTKFDWNPDSAEHEIRMLNPDKIEKKVPEYARQLAGLHGEQHWKEVMQKTAVMLRSMGALPPLKEHDLGSIQAPVLLLLGDEDTMVSTGETEWAAGHLAHSEFQLLPETPHQLEKVRLENLTRPLLEFINK